MVKQELSCNDILKEIQARHYSPIYYLMGQESYYIDVISDFIANHILSESEKEFNQTIVYGSDVDVSTIITMARRYPMMSEYQVIIVKEAQNLKNIDELIYYLQKPLSTTILVICHKNGVLDRRKKLVAEIQKAGVLFEAKKLKDAQLPTFISSYMARKGIEIDPKSTAMLSDSIGTDLSRLVSEIDKLLITLPQSQKRITPELVEKNIGISKDFNNFELQDALMERNVFKANQIVNYLAESQKNNPIQITLGVLFNFYANLMLAYYAPERTEAGVAAYLGLRSPFMAKNYLKAMQQYTGKKVMQIIHDIRYCDAKCKGVYNSSTNSGDLLRELIFNILH